MVIWVIFIVGLAFVVAGEVASPFLWVRLSRQLVMKRSPKRGLHRVATFGLGLVAAAAFVLLASELYQLYFDRAHLSTPDDREATFFALQTLTTIGYGGPFQSVNSNQPETYVPFQQVANIAMLPGALVLAFNGAAIWNLFFPAQTSSPRPNGAAPGRTPAT